MAKTTTARGLGWQHQQIRRRLIANHRDGTPCWWCGKPMYREPSRNPDYVPGSQAPGNGALAADHTLARANGGNHADRLLHGLCNKQRGDGSRDDQRPALGGTGTPTVASTSNDPLGRRVMTWPW